ncbi:MAG: MarR family transcriptional regulator, partial [Vagococcus sp.]
MTKKQSSRQVDVLRYIYEQVEERGYPPTVREIGEAVNLSSTSTVHGHLSRLEKKGLIYIFEEDPYNFEEVLIEIENQVKKFIDCVGK